MYRQPRCMGDSMGRFYQRWGHACTNRLGPDLGYLTSGDSKMSAYSFPSRSDSGPSTVTPLQRYPMAFTTSFVVRTPLAINPKLTSADA